MPTLCCFSNQKKSPRSSFRDRLPDHIKKLTVDVTFTKTKIQPQCVKSPKVRYNYDYDYESDCASDSDNDVIASLSPNFGCSKL
jgi:hypothetical protein